MRVHDFLALPFELVVSSKVRVNIFESLDQISRVFHVILGHDAHNLVVVCENGQPWKIFLVLEIGRVVGFLNTLQATLASVCNIPQFFDLEPSQFASEFFISVAMLE